MITKEELRQKVMDLKHNWLDDDFEKNVETILELGGIDFDEEECNYKPAFPILCAILQKCINSCTYGSSYEESIRECKRKTRKYLNTGFWNNHYRVKGLEGKTYLKERVDYLWHECIHQLDILEYTKAKNLPQYYPDCKGFEIDDVCCRFRWIAKIDNQWVCVDGYDGTQYQLNVLALEWLCEFIDNISGKEVSNE